MSGTYSRLRITSLDEVVARDMVLGKMNLKPDGIIVVADATNLHMVLEVKNLGLPMVVSLNLSDVAYARGLRIDSKN